MTRLNTSPGDSPGAQTMSSPAAMPTRRNVVAEALIAHQGFGNAPVTVPGTGAGQAMLAGPQPEGATMPLYAMPEASGGRVLRTSMMVAVFFIGALIGLGATWWWLPGATVPTQAQAQGKGKPAAAPSRLASGTSLDELPYEEAASSAESARTGGAPQAGLTALAAVGGSHAEGAADTGAKASIAQRAMPAADEPALSPGPHAASRKAAPSAGRMLPAQRNAKGESADPPKRAHGGAARGREHGNSGAGIARNDEPGKRETPPRRAAPENAARGAHPAAPSKQLALARCESKSNFILKEHCRWEVCNGSWGRNGCPSYERQASIY